MALQTHAVESANKPILITIPWHGASSIIRGCWIPWGIPKLTKTIVYWKCHTKFSM